MLFERDLTILFERTGFVEHSQTLEDYSRDDVQITIQVADFLYIGLYKPFNQLYVEMTTPNTTLDETTTAEYYNGTAFTPVEFFRDDTTNYIRNGFQNWKKSDDWAESSVNGDSLFWIRLSTSVDTSAIDFRAINILYASDNDLTKENSTITRFLPTGEISFANLHSRVRDDIVQSIRNRGHATHVDDSTKKSKNISKWDFLDFDEIRQAAIYYALEKVYFQASDGSDDKWLQRSNMSKAMGDTAMNMFYLSLDHDDDGEVDPEENLKLTAIQTIRI